MINHPDRVELLRSSVHIVSERYQLPEDEIQFFIYLLTYQCAVARTMPTRC